MIGFVNLKSVGKTFETGEGPVRALSTTSLSIDKGRFLAIVGPSGCGKSTLLRLVAGLLTPTEGEVTVDGKPVLGPRNDLGIMFQDPVLLPWRTVLANVLLPAEIMKLEKEAARDRARKLLEMVGLAGFESRYPSQLSGGEQQRVAMVRTLLPNPQVLLLDEPFGALDAMTREQLNLDLQRIWLDSGKTVVLITHSIQEAVFLGDDVAVMSSRPGQIMDTISVQLPRPRTFEIVGDAAFGRVAVRVRHSLEGRSTGLLEDEHSVPAVGADDQTLVRPELEGGRVPRSKS